MSDIRVSCRARDFCKHLALLVDRHLHRTVGNRNAGFDGITVTRDNLAAGIQAEGASACLGRLAARHADTEEALTFDCKIVGVFGGLHVALSHDAVDRCRSHT